MKLSELNRHLWRKQAVLMTAGLSLLILTVVLATVAQFDAQQILGINRWIKPVKFTFSAAIFVWTIAVYLFFLPEKNYRRSIEIIGWGTAAVMLGEITLIVIQAWRGTTSHFNVRTLPDSAIFGVMGLMILINTLLVAYLTFIYFRASLNLPQALVWGMRLGLIVFLFGSIEGGYMSAQMGHAIGVRDGGAGLPFVNWSTEAGDLRVAHFVGLHAIQAIPLFSILLLLLHRRFAIIRPTALTFVFAILYFISFTMFFVEAWYGRPLLGREIIITRKFTADEESIH